MDLRLFLLCITAGGSAVIAFISLRSGFLLASVLAPLVLLTDWLVSGFIPGAGPMERHAAIVLAANALAPLFLAWREERGAWRKAPEVFRIALSDSLGPFLMAAPLTIAALCAAGAAGYWPGAFSVALWLGVYLILGLVMASVWLVGFGALIGRER